MSRATGHRVVSCENQVSFRNRRLSILDSEVVPKRLCREGVSPSRSLPRDAMPSGKSCQRFDAGYCPILYERASEDSEPCEYSVAGYFWDVLSICSRTRLLPGYPRGGEGSRGGAGLPLPGPHSLAIVPLGPLSGDSQREKLDPLWNLLPDTSIFIGCD